MNDTYTHGHHASVLRSHTWRTAQNSAAHLLGSLKPGQSLLDIGCGPGTITADLARLVAPGLTVGLDASQEIIDQARAGAASVENLSFQVGDAYALPFADCSFDVVHAHQVLQHLTDPVGALREWRRVVAPGGVIALRESDYGGMTWYPPSPGLDEWNALYHRVTAQNDADADAGRKLLSWALEAGFTADQLQPGAGTWCYAAEDRRWWAESWAERCLHSGLGVQAVAYGLAEVADLERLAEAWREWGRAEDGWFVVLHGELIARC